MYKVKCDIYSNFKKLLYAKAGTRVKLISDCGNVLIVEDEKGFRFPVESKDVTKIIEPIKSK